MQRKKTTERIQELINDYRSSHYNAPGAAHPAIKRRLDRDVNAFTEDLHALLLALQDEQKEVCARFACEHCYDEMMNAPYAYNPNKETA